MKITAKWVAPETREIDLSDCFEVQFGEGKLAIVVSVRDGRVDIRTNYGGILLRPRASNNFEIMQEPW